MISLIRVDDRLIHGQVMAVWVRALNITHIIVVDDDTAADLFSQQVMRLAIPQGMALTISPLSTATESLRKATKDGSHTLVLIRSIDTAVKLFDHFPYKDLNVGGIGMSPGRKLLWRSIAASQQEVDQLRGLRDAGVNVYLQMIPSEPRRSLDQALRATP